MDFTKRITMRTSLTGFFVPYFAIYRYATAKTIYSKDAAVYGATT